MSFELDERRKIVEMDAKSLTDDLPVCPETGAGFAVNQTYKEDGTRQKVHKIYDRSFHCQQIDTRTCLYVICSGENGHEVAEFAIQKITAEILFGQLNNCTAEEVKDVLRQAFVSAEKDYLNSIDEYLAEKTELQCQIPENISQYDVITSSSYEDILNELVEIYNRLTIGSSAVLTLIYNSHMYICNIGNCRALLCKTDENNVLRVNQMCVDHNVHNEDEALRLSQLGIDVQAMKHSPFQSTRCIGCYSGKAGYKDNSHMSGASSEPVISQPEIIGPIPLDDSCRFLVLLSGGLRKILHDIYPNGAHIVNREIVQMIVEQFRSQSTLSGVSQSVVHKVVQMHHDAYMRQVDDPPFHGREDITLLVRNFNYPMPNAIHTQRNRNNHLRGMMMQRPPSTQSTTTFFSSSNFSSIINTTTTYSTNSSTLSTEPSDTIDRNRKVRPYVDFTDYYKNVEAARVKGTLPPSIEFD